MVGRRDQREEEPVGVADEVPAVRLECRTKSEVPLVDVAAGRGVHDPQVQVVQVHARAGCQPFGWAATNIWPHARSSSPPRIEEPSAGRIQPAPSRPGSELMAVRLWALPEWT